ncbi:MAG: PspA/IM30 family protein, partial [Plesiomonas shigelloides]
MRKSRHYSVISPHLLTFTTIIYSELSIMSIWKKLFTAVKGGVNEAAETIADSQALRILDQEIREAKEELRQSDSALASI